MSAQPLTNEDFETMNGMLVRFGNENSIRDVSELDGFLTALLMNTEELQATVWLPAIWGGLQSMPAWDEEKSEQFMALCTRMRHEVTSLLANNPKQYAALFGSAELDGQEVNIVDKWCAGFMRGVTLCQWSELPDEQQTWLNVIALHGLVENQAVVDSMEPADYHSTVQNIEPAVRALYAYWKPSV